ncbi:cupin domain-containing protein [Nonomuraea africana]|uniref:cupin domain-containing protein n=1 Tax=Nonomuraea africana TaxID=46171 RepID=UPI0033F6A985
MRFVGEDQIKTTIPSRKRFTDGVWEAEILDAVREGGMRAHRFFYRPQARSSWHTHDGEQAILVLAGRGVLVRWGESKGTEIGPGDWIHVEPGEKHWHGAAADNTLVHIAVTASGKTHWHEPVSDEEYRASLE